MLFANQSDAEKNTSFSLILKRHFFNRFPPSCMRTDFLPVHAEMNRYQLATFKSNVDGVNRRSESSNACVRTCIKYMTFVCCLVDSRAHREFPKIVYIQSFFFSSPFFHCFFHVDSFHSTVLPHEKPQRNTRFVARCTRRYHIPMGLAICNQFSIKFHFDIFSHILHGYGKAKQYTYQVVLQMVERKKKEKHATLRRMFCLASSLPHFVVYISAMPNNNSQSIKQFTF